jgi:hypothetical protein
MYKARARTRSSTLGRLVISQSVSTIITKQNASKKTMQTASASTSKATKGHAALLRVTLSLETLLPATTESTAGALPVSRNWRSVSSIKSADCPNVVTIPLFRFPFLKRLDNFAILGARTFLQIFSSCELDGKSAPLPFRGRSGLPRARESAGGVGAGGPEWGMGGLNMECGWRDPAGANGGTRS